MILREVWLLSLKEELRWAGNGTNPKRSSRSYGQVDVLTTQGQSVAEAIRSIGVTEVTYYRWRQEYGGLKSDQVKRLKDLEQENARLRKAVSDLTLEKLILKRLLRETGKSRSPSHLCRARQEAFGVSERFACRVLGQHRSTQRKIAKTPDDEAALTADIIALALQYGRYGYRRIAALLRNAGWVVNVKRVERIWRREGLKVPAKQPKRKRLWLNDGSCIRLRPQHPNHVWSYDFVEDRTHDGRKYRMLNIIDEFTRECLAIRIDRKLNSTAVIDVLSDLFILRGVPGDGRRQQWPGVHRQSRARLDRGGRRQDRGTSNPAAHGRTTIAKASTRSFATNC